MYDKKSLKAEDFIDHNEILETLDYAENKKMPQCRPYIQRAG